MTIGISRFQPLDYTGPTANTIPITYFNREPTVTDKRYPIGQFVIISESYLKDFLLIASKTMAGEISSRQLSSEQFLL